MPRTKREIGAELRKLRGDRSRADVANAVGVSGAAIGMYENGVRIPRDSIKVELAKLYGKTVGEIFYGEDAH